MESIKENKDEIKTESIEIDVKTRKYHDKEKKSTNPTLKKLLEMQSLTTLLSLASIFFAIFAMFLAFCGAGKAVAVFFIFSSVFAMGAIGTLTADCIIKKCFKPSFTFALVGFAILLLFI